MLNKNESCYNIENNFKYRTVVSTIILQFSEHFKLIFDNSNANNDKQIKQKMTNLFSVNFSKLSNFSSLSFWVKPIRKKKLLLLTTTARRSCCTLVSWVVFYFFTNFFGTNFNHQNKNYVVKTKYKRYFFGDFLSADFWQKLWE